MKKRFSIFTVVIVGFLMMAVGVGATAGYVHWEGTQDYQDTRENQNSMRIAVNKLFGDKSRLEKSEEELQGEIDGLKKKIKESGNDDIQSLIDERDALSTERDALNTKLVKSQEKIESVIDATNGINGKGKGQRYDELKKGVNELSSILYDSPATGAPVINGNHGDAPKSKELKQAEEDMKSIKEESSDLLEFIEKGEYDEDLTE